jgi:6-phosphogluconolactonase
VTASLQLPQNWQLFPDPEAVAQACAKAILKAAQQAIAERGQFHFISAGGTTPNRVYQLLSQAEADWQNWFIYMGDERVLPANDPERNSQALDQHWLKHSPIPQPQCFFMKTELGIESAAIDYAKVMAQPLMFDYALLGMGEDGHTASLFPEHDQSDSVKSVNAQGQIQTHAQPALEFADADIVMELDSPKPPAERVSLSYEFFKRVRTVNKLITGESKQEAIQQWLAQLTHQALTLPIARVQGQITQVMLSAEALPKA